MADFHVKIISSNRTFYEGVCHCLILPAVDGEMAVMAHHESEIVAVKAGEMRFQATEDGPWEAAVVGQGFCEIANNRVMLLADTIEKPEEIDRIRAPEALERAERAAAARNRVFPSITAPVRRWRERWVLSERDGKNLWTRCVRGGFEPDVILWQMRFRKK